MADFNPLKIQDIKRETPQAVSLTFDVPQELKQDYTFKAGQYITLKTEINGKEVRRSYSLCSTPGSGLLKVTVKEVPGGTFSVEANSSFEVGQTLMVHPPEGRFVFEPETSAKKDYAAFAAGSGITPVMSIMKTILEEEPKSRFVLVYGNKSLEETIYYKELLALQLKYGDRLDVEFVYSRTQEPDTHFGRIERSTVNYVVKNKFKGHDFDRFYLCGPEQMINMVTEVLTENKVAKDNIHFELFSSDDQSDVSASLDGRAKIKIIVDDEEFEFDMPQDEIILDAALSQGIDAPHSCQGGICASCIARVTNGSATMRKNQILTDDEVAEGLVLTCQAHPTSASITIDYDEA
ncbi:ferredoxin--NADP reductase [Flavimarina sp. Hel_I_48]|uniref:ferredoxin--NADP reductase n=1 Tax=Flavimarina sp. Hel_I_48 TaxID=1392488 RepID=UPI0004DF96EF|nr:ferredoxin--NADP reductase [Flavimarina sp. Hel_I_48]